MDNFIWIDTRNSPWTQRFPDWAAGYPEWSAQQQGSNWDAPDLTTAAPIPPSPRRSLRRPRLFVSHRQNDVQQALRIAYLADLNGFEFWVDVLDPAMTNLLSLIGTQTLTADQQALATAAVIEMGLLNSTHLMAALTSNTPGSAWVPYEYGRVKTRAVHARTAACWIDSTYPTAPPEYLHLGEIEFSEPDVVDWLRREFTAWKSLNGSSATAPAGGWGSRAVPKRL